MKNQDKTQAGQGLPMTGQLSDLSDDALLAAVADALAAGGEVFPRNPRDVVRHWLARSQDRRSVPPNLESLLMEAAIRRRADTLEQAAAAYLATVGGDMPCAELTMAARNLEAGLTEDALQKMREDRRKAASQEPARDAPIDLHRRAR